MLMTHRNLNFVATIVASCMAAFRSQRQRPSPLYLGVGAAGVGLLAYTAYLGSKLVYESGAGVEPAHDVYSVEERNNCDFERTICDWREIGRHTSTVELVRVRSFPVGARIS